MKNEGLLLVVSGPSGVGKGTVCSEYMKLHGEGCALSVSATTRAPREGEKDGVSYFFISEEEFVKGIENGDFLENAVFCNHRYGTPKKNVLEKLAQGKNVILEIDVQGAAQVKKHYPEAVCIFVIPPSVKELEKRLRGRNTESDDVVKKRLERSIEEFHLASGYDYVLLNDSLPSAINTLNSIINAEKSAIKRNIDFIEKEFC